MSFFNMFSIGFYAAVDTIHIFFPLWTIRSDSVILIVVWMIYFIPPLFLTFAFFSLIKNSGYLLNHSVQTETKLPSSSIYRIRIQYILFFNNREGLRFLECIMRSTCK